MSHLVHNSLKNITYFLVSYNYRFIYSVIFNNCETLIYDNSMFIRRRKLGNKYEYILPGITEILVVIVENEYYSSHT